MILPQPVPDSAMRRLRSSYALLMLLMGLPVLAAIVYVVVLQFQIVSIGVQRQIATSAEQRVLRLDAVLSPLRDNLLRLRNATQDPVITPDVPVDRNSLSAVDPAAYTLDALPPVLHQFSPQIVLVSSAFSDTRQRDAAITQAALFAQQARLSMSESGGFRRVYYVDAQATQLWVFPWLRSDQLLTELGAADLTEAVRILAQRHAPLNGVEPAFRDTVDWSSEGIVGGDVGRTVTATVALILQERPGTIAAEVPAGAFDAGQVLADIGRFWVVDAEGRLVWSRGTRDKAGANAQEVDPPAVTRPQIDRALEASLAIQAGTLMLSARRSSIAPWRGLYANDGEYVRAQVLRDIGPYAAGGAVLLLLFAAAAGLLWRHFARPSLRLVDYLHRKAIDPTATEPAVPAAWAPWMRLTRDTFGAASDAHAREQQALTLKSAIVDHALAAIVSTDARGRIVEFNPAAEAMFGRTRSAVLGHAVSTLIVPERYRAAHTEGMQRMSRGEPARIMGRRVEMASLHADGSEFPVEMVLWRTEVDGESHYTASLTDLSERRAAAQQIEQQREALRQSEKLTAMGSLLAGVAHELNNPLAIVMGRASLLEEKCGSVPELKADTQHIRTAAERCGRIVRTFLNMARQKPTERSNVQLNDLVRAAVDLLGYTFRSHGVDVQLGLAAELPEVRADGDQIGQVVLNLLVNAQQTLATAGGERIVRVSTGVEVRRDNREPRVWLRVADSGEGVPDALREKIFEPYFTTKSDGHGTGLGLAVSRSLVRDHGGELGLEHGGNGAVFRLSLPISGQPHAITEPGQLEVHEDAGPARILVVDDESELAEVMREMLEGAGFEVATAESGAVALELLGTARFDAIVSDLRMPDMDGAGLWRQVKQHHPAMARRLLFVTGDTLSPGARQFLDESRCASLDKPFERADLLARVRALTTG